VGGPDVDVAPYESKLVSMDDVPSDTRRGGDLRTLLSPKTVGSHWGFMGVARIAPGDSIAEHYHPYSEEFVFLFEGNLVARIDGDPKPLPSGSAIFIPILARHKFINESDEDAFMVFHLCPLAPRPPMGHVDTE
jgi:quercetin dioxygenase-like cupin family protein